MSRAWKRALFFLLGLVLVVYIADWGVLRIRMSRQTAFRSIPVDQFLGTQLKGEKEEYDYIGTTAMTCARSIFPHASAPPCWWLERHRTQWEH